MALDQSKIFHESWYRVAQQNIHLKAEVHIRRQLYRGQLWFVLFNPMNNQFFRLRPEAYQFVARLSSQKTVEQVWQEQVDKNPQTAPGQEEVIQLLAQLYHANLLHYNLAEDSQNLFKRYKKRKQKIWQSNLLNIMFFRIPLIDPDQFLVRTAWIGKMLFSALGAILFCLFVGNGLKLAIDNFAELRVQSQGILAPDNLFWLYLSMVMIKTLHEFGHSYAVRRFGGEVHTMGVMFLIFTPIPYMDATAAWAFRSKWKRLLVGAAGMLVEVFIASIAMIVWSKTGPGLAHSLAYNIVFIASVSTLIFNINPLLRFDGYYMLSDYLDLPNLHQHARGQLVYLCERFLFGLKNASSFAANRKEAWIYGVFGVLSQIYRIFVFTSILLFVADRFLILGAIMAVVCLTSWTIVPFYKLLKYLISNPRLQRQRSRAISVCAGGFAGIILFLGIVPFPDSFKAPGVLKTEKYQQMAAEVPGRLETILVPSGSYVQAGQALARLENTQLQLELRAAQAQLAEAMARRQQVFKDRSEDLEALESYVQASQMRVERLNKDLQALEFKAPFTGLWVAPRLSELQSSWLAKGQVLGSVLNEQNFYFTSVVSQSDISSIFSKDSRKAEVRLKGQASEDLKVTHYTAIPAEQNLLPSQALGWGAGGDVAVDLQDQTGRRTMEPFYEVRAWLKQDENSDKLYGHSGKIRFQLPYKPLLAQWSYDLRRMIQKRYQF